MANWAIVIGIDKYWNPKYGLAGSVRDAIGVIDWLKRPDGGAVPQRNIKMLLDRGDKSPPAPPGMDLLTPTRDGIIVAIDRILQDSSGQGESFYFYFSGHGISARKDFYEESAILPSDFSELLTDKALSLRSIYELFRRTSFQRQFFIVDACRDLPWDREYRISDYPDSSRQPVRPVPPQFIIYATSSGTKAFQVSERGAFTEALLDALKGSGVAKEWDDDAQNYVVRWDNVFKQVKKAVEDRKIDAGAGAIQSPRQAGEHSDENPVLGQLAPDAVPDVTLEVFLEPETVAPQAEVVVGHVGGEVQRKSRIDQLPVQFFLKPRDYSVRAIAQGFRSQRDYYPIRLYLPRQETIKLDPLDTGATFPRGVEAEALLRKLQGGPVTPDSIEVRASDGLARLELVNSAGQLLAKGEGYLFIGNLAPGFYRVRLITPEGQQAEELIELQPGWMRTVQPDAVLVPDTPLFKDVLTTTGMQVSGDNTVEPSEAVGPLSTAQLSTLLALAGGAANEETDLGVKLRRLGVSAFKDFVGQPATCGIQVLFGIEANGPSEAEAYLSQTQLRWWKQQDTVPILQVQPRSLLGPAGLAEYAWATSPGPHWLSIGTAGQRPIAFAVTVLPNRLSLLVFHRDVDDNVAIYQYLPALVPGPQDFPDSRRFAVRFPLLQRSELIQRAYLAGRLERPQQNAEDLLYAKWIEPIAGVLGGYILLRVDPTNPLLDIASGNMVRYFGELGDSHVLRAEYLDSQGLRDEAEQGLAYLLAGIARHGIEHPQVDWMQQMYERRVPGLLWTAVPVESL